MGALEIFLIVFGLIIVVVSFIFGEQFGNSDKDTKYDNANIAMVTKELVSKEVESELANVIDEKIEKAEVELDKITNQKILALGDYSDDVNAKISKNHDEVMFLYDMLSDKEKTIKNTVKDIEALKVSVKQMAIANDFARQSAGKKGKSEEKNTQENIKTENQRLENQTEENKSEENKIVLNDTVLNDNIDNVSNTDIKTEDSSKSNNTLEENGRTNNNKAILDLYNAGKSNIEIAKELGLGMGEVKLVIDLFKLGKNN